MIAAATSISCARWEPIFIFEWTLALFYNKNVILVIMNCKFDIKTNVSDGDFK